MENNKYHKYIKYKTKYLNLKKILKNNNIYNELSNVEEENESQLGGELDLQNSETENDYKLQLDSELNNSENSFEIDTDTDDNLQLGGNFDLNNIENESDIQFSSSTSLKYLNPENDTNSDMNQIGGNDSQLPNKLTATPITLSSDYIGTINNHSTQININNLDNIDNIFIKNSSNKSKIGGTRKIKQDLLKDSEIKLDNSVSMSPSSNSN